MFPRAMLAALALAGAVGLSLAQPTPQETAPATPPAGLTIGADGPPDPATVGTFVFHTNVHVRDPAASIKFYGDALGMRRITTIETPAKDYSLTLMAHGQGGRNGTGFMTGPELAREATNIAGGVELIYSREWNEKYPERTVPSAETGLSHLGVVVPDAKALQARLERDGYKIIKPLGAAADAASEELATTFGVDFANKTRVAEVFGTLNTFGLTYAFHVADPDGNIIEAVQADFGSEA